MTQIFRNPPSSAVFKLILQCFNCFDIEKRPLYFEKCHLELYGTVEKIRTIRDEMIPYYYPNKFIQYVLNLDNVNACITILRQWMNEFNYVLTVNCVYSEGVSTRVFCSRPVKSALNVYDNYLIEFDI
jgi:hypothetical protein